jgi:cytochrome c oxidase assembly protein subunit 15
MNLERTPSTVVSYPRWLRGWSALTVGVSFAAIIVGTLVTTFGVGMADTVWPTPPWYLLFHQRAADFGWYVEHTHRIAAYLVGGFVFVQSLGLWHQCADRTRRLLALGSLIALAIGLGEWMRIIRGQDRAVAALVNYGLVIVAAAALVLATLTVKEVRSRAVGRWTRAFVTVAALGVITQAMLGGLRVYLNERAGQELRVVHGIVAQVVFASVCLLAMMVGRGWNSLVDLVTETPLRKLSLATVILALVQIAFGGLLRHLNDPLARRLHPMLAFAVVILIVWTAARTFAGGEGAMALRGKAFALLATVALQAVLGVEALVRTMAPDVQFTGVTVGDAALRSLHVLVGFGVFSSAALLAARAWKARLI